MRNDIAANIRQGNFYAKSCRIVSVDQNKTQEHSENNDENPDKSDDENPDENDDENDVIEHEEMAFNSQSMSPTKGLFGYSSNDGE